MNGHTTHRAPAKHALSLRTIRQSGYSTLLNLLYTCVLLLAGGFISAQAAPQAGSNSIQAVDFASLPGNKAVITLTMSQPTPTPLSFTIDNPARIALDFPNTSNGLAQRKQTIGIGMADSMAVVESKGRTRVVVNLLDMVPYEAHSEGNKVILTIQNAGSRLSEAQAVAASAMGTAAGRINNIDFRRGEAGEGRVIITLSDPAIPVDMQQEDGKVVVDFYRATMPQEMERRLDVLDFATPVKTIDAYSKGDNVHMVITPKGAFEYIAYQSGNQFTIEVRGLTKKEEEEIKKDEFGYLGERLSLNFQDIEARSVLQLIADFTGINIVVSDTVGGRLTLRLKNVPWDQALDIILKTKGLAMRQTGNVMLIAPSEEIAAREKLELESQKQIEELEPVYAEFIQINYAKAADIATLLKSEETSMLSTRGRATIDERTNTLLIQDTASKLAEVRSLVARLDVPIRQVLIESRIVIANNDFTKDIGVTFGISRSLTDNDRSLRAGGRIGAAGDAITPTGGVVAFGSKGLPTAEGLMVDLPAIGATSSFGLAIGRIGSHFLQMELTAMEAEGHGEVISSPRVITSNQKAAYIKSGVEVPYQEASSSGATSVSFKEAVLSLQVTPQITPDDRIIMDLQVNKDSIGAVFLGVPSIATNEISTQVLVDNGETLVLGGIYEQTNTDSVSRVPFFGELPLIDWMFNKKLRINNKKELLIFVTPKIVREDINI